MTPAPDPGSASIETAARALAARHAISEEPPKPLPSHAALRSLPDWLHRARERLLEPEAARTKLAEWFLDNAYLVERAVRQVRKDLPTGFYRRLPALSVGPLAGTPRAYGVVHGLLRACDLQANPKALSRFVHAYQESVPLDLGELWALPALLRLSLLETLVQAIAEVVGLPLPFSEPPDGASEPGLDATERVARSVGGLRAVSSIRWKALVREWSVLESVLAEDPVRAYARMDFETSDRYRRAVEDLARRSRHSEVEVARRAIGHAREAAAGSERHAHIGYWLVDEGRRLLERSIGYRPPASERLRRAVLSRPGSAYAITTVLATAGALAMPFFYLSALRAEAAVLAIGLALSVAPALALAVSLVNALVTRLFPPHVLPKMAFDGGIPADASAAVVVPALLTSVEDATALVRRLEIHHLANPDPSLRFALLTDLSDAPEADRPGDREIVAQAVSGVRELNRRHGKDGRRPFHLLHRARRWSPAEGCWMGWERKRGKLEEFDRLLAGARDTTFVVHEGDAAALLGVRYVLTLDADTRLPRGVPARLLGALAHPLNRPVFDASGRVVAGYTVLQPRVEVAPESAARSRFARLASGDGAIDIYSRAVSDAYQDLFGAGIYVGKGLYDSAAFRRSLEGRAPENALVSHDLFEGVHGRVGLATDAVLYEGYPQHYLAYSRRLHRWIRGDWQLLPWLFRRVPAAGGGRVRNRLAGIDRWKILDNLRRSVLPVALLLFFAGAWLLLPGSPVAWTLFGVLAPVAPLFADFATGLSRGHRRSPLGGRLRAAAGAFREGLGRWFLVLAFLPHESRVALDAVARTLWRLAASRKHLLEWTTAAHTARALASRGAAAVVWGEMAAAPLVSLALCGALAAWRPEILPVAAPLLLLWLGAPEIARALSRRIVPVAEETTEADRLELRLLARRTWFFFATFVGPEDQWLPPDNFQEDPRGDVAHRTSPTNVGAMLLSTLAAWDLGYLGSLDLRIRIRATFDTLARMERHRGHLLNWVDTRTLDPLLPRYVSTVDSGNLAAALWTLEQGLVEVADAPILRDERWDGASDTLALLDVAVRRLFGEDAGEDVQAVRAGIDETRRRLDASRGDLHDLPSETEVADLARRLARAIGHPGRSHEAGAVREARLWTDRLRQSLHALARDRDLLLPWLPLLSSAPSRAAETAARIATLLPASLALRDVSERVGHAGRLLSLLRSQNEGAAAEPTLVAWLDALESALDAGAREARATRDELRSLARRARAEVDGMDFRLLYDPDVHLFHIGYNLTADRLDPNHYDLLASESRLASLVAIAKGDVPQKHWFFLGRPVTRVGGSVALLSWGGTMFEYLMPALLLRSAEGTLLDRSQRAAVDEQMRHGARLDVPWGVSESGYAAFDVDQNYQYRAFGTPGLGLKRGLEDELVIAPYASVLALPVRPKAVADNVRRLVALGLSGTYGLYEAADFTPARVPQGQRFVPVRSYMAHHQGMILVALGNHLCGDAMIRRFRASPRMRTVDILLHERVPAGAPTEEPLGRVPATRPPEEDSPRLPSWRPVQAGVYPETLALGNGRLTSLVTDSGAGGLRWNDQAITRWAPGPTLDAAGVWIYVRDEESGSVWSAGRQPTSVRPDEGSVVFHPHLAEFHRRDHGIGLRMEVAVAPADDVEIRRVTLVNETGRPRRIVLTSCAEVVLTPAVDWDRHPAFHRLFVWSEALPAFSGVLSWRRARSAEERPPLLLHRLVATRRARFDGFEADRERFLGRHGTWRSPRAAREAVSGTAGATLDTVTALRAVVDLAPNGRETVAFVTVVGTSRKTVLETAARYDTPGSLDWVVEDARVESGREARRLGLEPASVPDAHRLLALVLHPHGPLRGEPRAIEVNRLGQPGLWGFGVSGDLPILLVRVADPDDPTLLRDVLRAQTLWRRRGVLVDLVAVREGASSYADDVEGRIGRLVREVGAEPWMGRPGGVFVVRGDQARPEERRLLEVAARVVLDTRKGSLARQLEGLHASPHPLPPFPATEAPMAVDPIERPRDLVFDNGLGGFSPKGDEYVIHLEPDAATPAPWSNVIANHARFGCLVTEAGLGTTWSVNASERRLTPWSNDPVVDPAGEALYLRDEATAEVWTPTPHPAGSASACQVRHRAGSTEFRRRDHGLEQRLLVFAAAEDSVKLVRLRVKNLLDRPRRITATYYAQWVLGATTEVARTFVVPEYDAASGALLARSAWNPDFAARTAFLAADQAPHGFTTDRAEFLGREGDLARPAALLRWGLSGAVDPGRDACAALQVHLDIPPGGEARIHFVLGEGDSRAHALELARRWRSGEAVDAEAERVRVLWEERLGAVEVRTPDPALDVVTNRWLLYQALSARILGRTGFYQSSGAYGFRDQIQDVLALVHSDPSLVRGHLLACARHQFEEGDVLHWWHPPMDRGVRTRCSDDLLWLPYATACYVEATGDDSVLDAPAPFLRAEPLRPTEHDRYARFDPAPESRPLWDHCVRAIERGSTSGPHGLPLIGDGDWNDGMNRVGDEGRGESVWLAWFLASTLEKGARLAERRGERDRAATWHARARKIVRAAEDHGWDGAWYRRAFDDEGHVLGSSENEECRIDSIAQSWAVLSGLSDRGRARRALLSAESELLRDRDLLALLWPPFDRTPLDPGYVKAYPPGVRENGGQYNHAAAWLGLAFAAIGDGERAHAVFRRINPVSRSASATDARRYRVEPYVVVGDVYAASPHTGRGGWTWYSGAAAWTWRLAVEGILGLRREEGALVVDPSIPPRWPGFEARLRGPDGVLEVVVANPDGVGRGVSSMTLDGAPLPPGGRVALPRDGATHRLEVLLGRAVPSLGTPSRHESADRSSL